MLQVAKDVVNVDVYGYMNKNGKWMWQNIIPEPFRFLL